MAREGARFDRAAAPQMEGAVARMYARVRNTQSQITLYRQQAQELTAGLQDDARILGWPLDPDTLPSRWRGSASSR